MNELRKEEIRRFIEEDCNDWCKLKLLEIEYINKNKTMVNVIDDCEYKYRVELGVLRRSKRRSLNLQIFFRNNSYTYDNIVNYLRINNKLFALITQEPNNAIEKIIWNCPIHGEFLMSWNCVKNGQECPICGDLKASISRRNSYEYVKNEFEKRDLILISKEYINNEENYNIFAINIKIKAFRKFLMEILSIVKDVNIAIKKIQEFCYQKRTNNFVKKFIKHMVINI